MQVYREMVGYMTGRDLTPEEKERAAIAMQPNRKERRRAEREAKRDARARRKAGTK